MNTAPTKTITTTKMTRQLFKFSFIYSLIVLTLTMMDLSSVGAQLLDSPCPRIFQYRFDQSKVLYGMMVLNPPTANVIQVNMELSVGNRVEQGYNGNIELASSKEVVLNDIMHQRPIVYKVLFPFWRNIPPRVTAIYVNGDQICSGPKIDITQVEILTTITLQHTLRIMNVDTVQPTITFPPRVDENPNFVINFNPATPAGFDPSKNPFFNDSFVPPVDRHPPPKPPRRPPPSPPNNPEFEEFPFFQPAPTTTTSTTTTTTTTTTTRSPLIESHFPDFGFNSMPDVCGRPVVTNQLIVNGVDVPRGAYPWLSAIFRVSSSTLSYICSGTLVSKKHVITAAHCVYTDNRPVKPKDTIVFLGKDDITKFVLRPDEKSVYPERIHVHPSYTPSSSDADIAVIELSEELTYSQTILPICLWRGSTELSLVVGNDGVVAGWGRTEDGDASSEKPRGTTLPIVDQFTCLRSAHQFQHITSNRTFCAGSRNGSGPCNGDSGSGLVIKRDDVWYLRGIVSMSLSDNNSRTCDLKNFVVFTDVAKFLSWLKKILAT